MEYEIGRMVISKSGRDKGRFMVIVGIADENHRFVADGDLRKIEKPKKKKLMHLKLTNHSGIDAKTNRQLRAICKNVQELGRSE